MNNFFYGIGIILLIINIYYLCRLQLIDYHSQWFKAYRKVYDKEPNVKKDISKEDNKFITKYTITSLVLGIWLIIGLFTNQWIYFVILAIINISSIKILKIEYINDKRILRLFITYTLQTIKILTIAFILYNYFILIWQK
jgi:hypothetical protein